MAILSSSTLISSIGAFNLICAYFLLTAPSVVASHNLVTVLSATVNLPLSSWRATTDAVGLLAAVLALVAVSDISAVTMREEVAALYWNAQAPIRLTFFFALTGYAYSCRPGGLWAGRQESLNMSTTLLKGSKSGLGSGVVFTWAFLQTVWWFWVYLTLRDERRERAVVDKRGHRD